jgi:hypothetical protein
MLVRKFIGAKALSVCLMATPAYAMATSQVDRASHRLAGAHFAATQAKLAASSVEPEPFHLAIFG